MEKHWWSCPCSRDGALDLRARTPAPQLLVTAVPPSAIVPLVFTCSSCALRMVACESCHVLMDADKQSDGVLLCRRCGVLSVLDPTLRSVLALPAFDQSFLKRVSFAIAPIVRLRERIAQCEAPQPSAAPPSSEPSGESRHKRQRTDASPLAAATIAPSSELLTLQRELQAVVRQWEHFASSSIEPLAPLAAHPHQTFSATHLHIERFLVHQSTLWTLKLDVLAAIETCRASEQLQAPVFQSAASSHQQTTSTLAVANAARVVRNVAHEQLAHRYRAFQTLAHPHLALVSAATQQLQPLVSAARALQGVSAEHEADAAIQRTLFRSSGGDAASDGLNAATSTCNYTSRPRSHRRFGVASSSSSRSTTTGRPVSVQQSLAAGHRWSDVVKKVELWRALSVTVASSCVFSVSELAGATPVPLASA